MMMTAGLVGSVSSLHRLESGTHLGAHDIFGYVDSNDVACVQGLLTTERGPIYDVRYARNAEPLFATNFTKPDFDGCKRSFWIFFGPRLKAQESDFVPLIFSYVCLCLWQGWL